MNLFEQNILERFKNGDEAAFEYLFKMYYNFLINYAKQILKDVDAAEEVVEIAFVSLWENRATINSGTPVKPYLFKTVYNNCLNYMKHLHVKERYVLYFKNHTDTDDGGDIIDENYPLSQLIENETDQVLEKAINALPPQCREVFILSRYENLMNAEIAEKLNISVNTVRTQISRALNKLRINLKDYLQIILI